MNEQDAKQRYEAYVITAEELAARLGGKQAMPDELRTDAHLICNTPAAIDFNSPGAQGFGVKRAGLSVPGSIMLLVSPGCCGRNTAALSGSGHYGERFAYLALDETDIVTGSHLQKIPEAVRAFVASRAERPSVVMICLTCVDALLGTDMERVCRKAEAAVGLPVRPCYMYALTRESQHPPMQAVRETIYGLLRPRRKDPRQANLLGFFTPVAADSELFSLLERAGIRKVAELARCQTYSDFEALAAANFNLVLDDEAMSAALALEKRIGIPTIRLRRLYATDKIANQYRALAHILGLGAEAIAMENERERAEQAAADFCAQYGKKAVIAIGSRLMPIPSSSPWHSCAAASPSASSSPCRPLPTHSTSASSQNSHPQRASTPRWSRPCCTTGRTPPYHLPSAQMPARSTPMPRNCRGTTLCSLSATRPPKLSLKI